MFCRSLLIQTNYIGYMILGRWVRKSRERMFREWYRVMSKREKSLFFKASLTSKLIEFSLLIRSSILPIFWDLVCFHIMRRFGEDIHVCLFCGYILSGFRPQIAAEIHLWSSNCADCKWSSWRFQLYGFCIRSDRYGQDIYHGGWDEKQGDFFCFYFSNIYLVMFGLYSLVTVELAIARVWRQL